MSFADVSSIDVESPVRAEPRPATRARAVARPVVAAGRLLGLDWLRFAAALLMVQGHVFYVVLHESVTAEPWFRWHRYVHGLTAPMFLFGAGFAFAFVTLRAMAAGKPRSAAKRFERALVILLVGYVLQLPKISLDAVLALDAEGITRMLRANTLQCIAVTLLACEGALALGRTRRGFGVVVTLLAGATVLLAPAAWRLDVGDWPVFLSAFVNDHTGSLFPLFPWAGFLFTGAAVATWLLDPERRTLRFGATPIVFALGAAAWIGGKVLTAYEVNPFGDHYYWRTSPWFFLIRLGLVLMFFGALLGIAYLAQRRAETTPEPATRTREGFIQRIAAETLTVYVVHLVILYGSSWHRGLHSTYGPSLDLAQASIATLGVLGISLAVALAWHELKRVGDRETRWGVRAVLAIGFVRFLFV